MNEDGVKPETESNAPGGDVNQGRDHDGDGITEGEVDDWENQRVGGFALSDLSDYATAGRTPARNDIEGDVEAHRAVTQLERLRSLMDEVMREEGADVVDSPWIHRVMHDLRTEMEHGRSVPIGQPDQRTDFTMSEGALRSLIRAAGDSVGSAVVGKITFEGEISRPGSPVSIGLEVAIRAHGSLSDAAGRIQSVVVDAVQHHTALVVNEVVVSPVDLLHEHDGEPDHG